MPLKMKKETTNKTKFTSLLTSNSSPLTSVLIDPDCFDLRETESFLAKLPFHASSIFVGGSQVKKGATQKLVRQLKLYTQLPIVLFPGDYSQICSEADALLFLQLISGDNPEYLIKQQIKAVPYLKNTTLEIIPVGYILIDGGKTTSVEKTSQTKALNPNDLELILHTALASQYLGHQCVYLEAGSGAKLPVSEKIITTLANHLDIPIIVGGGIKNSKAMQQAFHAGAKMLVIGNALEKKEFFIRP